jgi:hypothetical protein
LFGGGFPGVGKLVGNPAREQKAVSFQSGSNPSLSAI